MSNKIKEVKLFHTPKDWPELERWIERHGPEDRVHIWTAAVMAWNLAASITNGDAKDEEVTDEAADA